MDEDPNDIAALATFTEDERKTVLKVLGGSEKYPPANVENWFCIRGRCAVILTGAEVAYILGERVHATNHPV